MAGPYIPAQDGEFDSWLTNFAALLTADPTAYGETVGTALLVQGLADDFAAAYTLAIDPGTRTPSTVAAKDAARAAADAGVRPVAMRINANTSVTDDQRSDLGITIRKIGRTPVPPPTTAPTIALVSAIPTQHKLSIRDEATPTSKAKPFGVIGVEIWRAVGTVAATDPAQCSLLQVSTKTPTFAETEVGDAGKIATYFARWQTRSGANGIASTGPWSAPLNVIVM